MCGCSTFLLWCSRGTLFKTVEKSKTTLQVLVVCLPLTLWPSKVLAYAFGSQQAGWGRRQPQRPLRVEPFLFPRPVPEPLCRGARRRLPPAVFGRAQLVSQLPAQHLASHCQPPGPHLPEHQVSGWWEQGPSGTMGWQA